MTKLKELPADTVQDILNGVNAIGEPEISVNVSKFREKPEDEFVFYFVINMNALIQDPVITKQDIAVLMQYAARMQYGNQLNISQIDIAEDLNIDKSKVSKSVKKLIERGVFYKEGRSLFMNWKFLAKGNLTEFIKAEKEKQKLLSEAPKLITKGKCPPAAAPSAPLTEPAVRGAEE